MNHEQRRAFQRAEKEGDKAEAALKAMPTVEASTRRESLSSRFASVRNSAARSEHADATLRAARGTRKDANEAVVEVTSATVRMIAASGQAKLLPPFITDGSTSTPDVAEYLVNSLQGIPDAAMLFTGVKRTVDASAAAEKAEQEAEIEQSDAERKLYVTISEFNHELEDVHAYIKLNTELESAARQKLKRRGGGRRRQPKEEEETPEAKADTTKPVDSKQS